MKKMKHLNFKYRLFKFVNMLSTWAYKGINYECTHDPSIEEYTYYPFFVPIFMFLMKIQHRIEDNEIINQYYKELECPD